MGIHGLTARICVSQANPPTHPHAENPNIALAELFRFAKIFSTFAFFPNPSVALVMGLGGHSLTKGVLKKSFRPT